MDLSIITDLESERDKLRSELDAARERERVLEAEKEGWMETAAQHLRNEDYYRGLVQGIGKNFGADAYISDDGSIQQDILCAKVPYLVIQMNERLWEVETEFAAAQDKITKLQNLLDGSPESYIRQLKERIEGHIEENEMLKERERVLREAATYAKIAIDNYIHKEWGVGEIQDAYDKLKAALERKEV